MRAGGELSADRAQRFASGVGRDPRREGEERPTVAGVLPELELIFARDEDAVADVVAAEPSQPAALRDRALPVGV